MKTFKGVVSQLRAVAVTQVQSGTSSARHETSIRFGRYSLNLVTRTPPSIHLGDELRVYGVELFGVVRPVVLRNVQNNYEAGFASGVSVILAAVVGMGLTAYGLNKSILALSVLGGTGVVVSAAFALLRHRAVAALRAA